MREELKAVMQEVRRNEALIEYMELKGVIPEQMRSIGDVTKTIIANMEIRDGSNALGYDFSYAEVLFQNETPTDRYKVYLDEWLKLQSK